MSSNRASACGPDGVKISFFFHDMWKSLNLKKKKRPGPVDITLLGAIAVMLEPEFVSDLVQAS